MIFLCESKPCTAECPNSNGHFQWLDSTSRARATQLPVFACSPSTSLSVRKVSVDAAGPSIDLPCYALIDACRDIQREEQKAIRLCKDAAKRNDIASAKIMAKELVHTRKAIKQLYTNKAQLVAMNATLSEQLATVKVAGTLSKSTEVSPLRWSFVVYTSQENYHTP